MKKNCVIILFTAMVLSSCKMSVNAITPTQNYSANITIIPVEYYKK